MNETAWERNQRRAMVLAQDNNVPENAFKPLYSEVEKAHSGLCIEFKRQLNELVDKNYMEVAHSLAKGEAILSDDLVVLAKAIQEVGLAMVLLDGLATKK